MAGSIPNQLNFGSYIPTTNIWEIQQIQDVNADPKLKELLIRLYQNINNISLVINTKDSAIYFDEEFVNSQIYFPNRTLNSTTSQSPTPRSIFRKVIDFGALPNATTKSVAHGISINSNYIFTRIYGSATNQAGFSAIPIPQADISITIDATNVNVTSTLNYSAYTITYIVLEFIKG